MKGYRLHLEEAPPKGSDKRYLVTGFPGFGAVGFIAIKFIVEKLRMRRIGFIDTPRIPDVTSLEDYGLSLPHEIFINERGTLVALLNRVNPERSKINSFAKSFLDLVSTLKVDEVILVGGVDSRFREGSEEYRWLATRVSDRRLKAPMFMKGPFIIGPLASLLLLCELRNIPAIAVFPYTEPDSFDHRAAAVAVKVVGEIVGVEVDVSELLQHAEMLERLEESLRQMYSTVSEASKRESRLYM